MTPRLEWTCHVCGHVGFKDGGDGFYYCSRCNSQADDIIETGVDEQDLFENYDCGIYSVSHRRVRPSQVIAAEPEHVSQVKLTQSQHLDSLEDFVEGDDNDVGDTMGPNEPGDFGSYSRTFSYDEYYSEIRLRYVTGFQIMIQLQCKALVEKCNVSPLIVGLVGPIWLRFLAFTRVMADDWADEVIHESESQKQGEDDDFHPSAKHSSEPFNMLGQRAVTIWHKSLCSKIPLSYSLAINFLVCHLVREVVLPTDIFKWTLEGKIPYFSAFIEIEKQLGPPSRACPISSSCMFRPTKVVPLQKLESLAAFIALKIGLELPPVNFYGVASRFLRQLSIPVKNIIGQACRIYEWSMPPALYISANKWRFPTRVCVMSILIVTIRIIYDLNGFGKWEMSLSSLRSSSSLVDNAAEKSKCCSDVIDCSKEEAASHDFELCENAQDDEDSTLDVVDLLKNLETKYSSGLRDTYDYSEDLACYLQYCKDVVFAGIGPSFEDCEEEKIIEELWDFYQNQKKDHGMHCFVSGGFHKRSRDNKNDILKESKECRDTKGNSSPRECLPLLEFQKEEAIRRLKSDMEDNKFCYIPPRKRINKLKYILYSRKKKEGAYVYAAHADYYILLRACARVAQVDLRTLHVAVLHFERRLKRLEGQIHSCLSAEACNSSSYSQSDKVGKNRPRDQDDCMDISNVV